jgi:hypothetical protein
MGCARVPLALGGLALAPILLPGSERAQGVTHDVPRAFELVPPD